MEILFIAGIGVIVGALVNNAADRLPPRRDDWRRFPLRVPFVLIAGAVCFSILWAEYGASVRLMLEAVYTTVFLLVLVIDMEHRLILNVVILPATLFAALASPLAPIGVSRSLLGGTIAYVVVFGFYLLAIAFARVRGYSIRVPFGFGDVKLAGFMGIVVGFPDAITAIVLTLVLGGVGALLFIAYQAIAHRRIRLDAAIPYGPYFCIAGWVLMVYGPWR